MRRLFLPLLLIAEIGFVLLYVLAEHTLYFWDYAMYQGMAAQWAASDQPFSLFLSSLSHDYNLIFAGPAALAFLSFGVSRLVFILSLFFTWFLAYQVALAFLLARVFHLTAKKAVLFSLLTCLAQPPLWVPLFEGYPDYGAAAALTFALALCLPEKQRSWPQSFGAGLLLGFAIAFRRHFAYAVLALGVADLLWTLLVLFRRKVSKRLWLTTLFAGPVSLGIGAGSAVFLLEPAYVLHALTTDFGALYQSYTTGFVPILWYGLTWNGLGWLFLTLCGFVCAYRVFPRLSPQLFFCCLFAFLWVLIWGLGPAQASLHYFLHAPFIWGSVGLTGLFLAGPLLFPQKIGRVFLALFLIWGSLWSLALAPYATLSNASNHDIGLFPAPRPPLVRHDLDQLQALGQYLEDTTITSDRIVAVGSSFIWNQDILRAIFTDLLKNPQMSQRQRFAPEIDGEQQPPFDAAAYGTVFIVPDRPQYHLDPKGQKNVTALASLFVGPLSHLFTESTQHFMLDDGTRLSVWRRRSCFKGKDLEAVVTSITQETHVFPPRWLSCDPGIISYLTPLAPGAYQIAFDLNTAQNCANFKGSLTLWPEGGEQSEQSQAFLPPLASMSLFYVPFHWQGPEKAYLTLSLDPEGLRACAPRAADLLFQNPK